MITKAINGEGLLKKDKKNNKLLTISHSKMIVFIQI